MTARQPLLTGLILVIEASTAGGSVALLRGDGALARIDVPMGASREDALFPAVQSVLGGPHMAPEASAQSPSRLPALDAIVCGSGPGSFTSLRIAGAIAKGLAQAMDVPLYDVSSLLLAAASHRVAGRYVVHSDALRGEAYALAVLIDPSGMVSAEGAMCRVSGAELVQFAAGRALLQVPKHGAASATDGTAAGIDATAVDATAVDATAIDASSTVLPDAAHLGKIEGWWDAGPVSLAAWEPRYGRLADAQVKWELVHGRALDTV